MNNVMPQGAMSNSGAPMRPIRPDWFERFKRRPEDGGCPVEPPKKPILRGGAAVSPEYEHNYT